MKISEFSVGEFGALRGISGKLAPRLSVVWGGNESGKTTLSRFFRRLLFVGPYGDEMPPQGEGALLLLMNDGRNIKIKLDGRKNFIGDADGSMTVMQEDFLPLDAKEYERVFLVGSVSPDMWPIGRLTGMNSYGDFLAAESRLEFGAFSNFTNRLDELERSLYTPSDPESSLNRLWADIKNNDLQIENLKNWKTSYWELRETLEEKRESVKNASSELEKNRLALARLELIARARPAWLEVRELEDELTSLAPIRDMPKRGIERLDSLRERIANLRRRLGERKRKNAYEASRRRQMEKNPILTLLKYREVLEDLERKMERIARTETETSALGAEMANAEESLKRELLDIAPHWSEKDLTVADLSLATERKARVLGNTIEALNGRIEKLLSEKTEEEGKCAALRAEIAAKRNDTENLASSPDSAPNPKPADYRARCELLLDIRREMFRYDALRWEIRGGKMCAEVIEREIKGEGSPPSHQGNYMAKFLLSLLLSLSGISVALGVLTPVLRPYDAYAILFCFLAALGPAFSIFMARKEHSVRLSQWRARHDRRNNELDMIDEKIVGQRREMQIIGASVEHKSQILGIRVPSTLFDLDEAARFLENENNGAAYLELKVNEREQLLANLKKCEAGLNRLKEKLSVASRELNSTLESWRNWLLQNRFDPDLSPESFGSFLTGARAARADLKVLDAMRRKLAYRRAYEASIDARISDLSAKTGLELDRGGLPAVFNSFKEALSLQARIEASLEDRLVVDFECSELESELAAAVSSLRALCEEAGAANEEGLRAAFEEQAQRLTLETRLEESKRALAGILSNVGKEASDISEPEFLAEASALAEETEALRLATADGEKALNVLRDVCGEFEAQMDSMVSDNRLFTLRQRNETLKGRAQKEFRRWLAAVLLKRFAGKTIERHKKSLEPEILRQARQFLSPMASSNWKIVADDKRDEGRNFCVALLREADGVRLDETQWSLGLAEQVSLSMRLAVASYLAERLPNRTEPVPMMLDDVLASFDEGRQRGAVEALWRASEKFQVIFFTCHRFTVDMFRSRLGSEKGFSVVEMAGNTFFKESPKARAKHSGKRR